MDRARQGSTTVCVQLQLATDVCFAVIWKTDTGDDQNTMFLRPPLVCLEKLLLSKSK